jgi:uncharacterized membrane protein YgcG
MRTAVLPRSLTVTLGLAVSACGSSDLTLPSSATPARLLRVSGDGQKASAGEQLPQPLIVRLTDENARASAGIPVVFRFQGTVPSATLDRADATTDSAGLAQVRVRLGTTVGTQTVEARVSQEVQSDLVATFDLTALEVPAPQGGGSGGGGNGGGGGGGGDDHGHGNGHGHGHADD